MSFRAMLPKISKRPSLQDVFAGFRAPHAPAWDTRPARPMRDARLYHEPPRKEERKRVRWGPPDIKYIDPDDTTKRVRWGPPQVRYIPPRSAAHASTPNTEHASRSVPQDAAPARPHASRSHHPPLQPAASARYHPYTIQPRQPAPRPRPSRDDGPDIFFSSTDASDWLSDFYPAPFEARLSLPAGHAAKHDPAATHRMRTFTSAAHYILAYQALLLKDTAIYKDALSLVSHDAPRLRALAALLHARHPSRAARTRYGAALAAHTAKFAQHARLRAALARTGRRVLVCVDEDEGWGVGPERAGGRGVWGRNEGGQVLMEVRALVAGR